MVCDSGSGVTHLCKCVSTRFYWIHQRPPNLIFDCRLEMAISDAWWMTCQSAAGFLLSNMSSTKAGIFHHEVLREKCLKVN